MRKRKKEDSYLNDIVDLEAKLKVFEKTACDKSLIVESENLRVEIESFLKAVF